MSRSNNIDLPNPASRFYQWNGSKGGFTYWDREKESRIEVPLPFGFMVLDCLSTIKGWSDADQSGFWANEVRDISKDALTVRTKKNRYTGTYRAIKANPNCAGAKYCQSVYIADRQGDELVIANIQLMGAALSSWIEFRKKHKNVYEGAIRITSMKEGKKGAVTFQQPIFEAITASDASNAQAVELDRELQNYLGIYIKRKKDESAEIIPGEEYTDEYEPPIQDESAPVDDLPF